MLRNSWGTGEMGPARIIQDQTRRSVTSETRSSGTFLYFQRRFSRFSQKAIVFMQIRSTDSGRWSKRLVDEIERNSLFPSANRAVERVKELKTGRNILLLWLNDYKISKESLGPKLSKGNVTTVADDEIGETSGSKTVFVTVLSYKYLPVKDSIKWVLET